MNASRLATAVTHLVSAEATGISLRLDAIEATVINERCLPLIGPNYPKRWTTCDEAAWQELCEDVDGEQAYYDERERSSQ